MRYEVEDEPETRTKSLVAPDGTRFPTVASILEAETRKLTPLERLMSSDLRELSADPSRADDLVDVTFIYRRQPLHEAGFAARGRADPKVKAALERKRVILDRIAPLRSLPGGRPPEVATAMQEEAELLSDDEKAALREVRDTVHDVLATMRREALQAATAAVTREQAPLAEYLRGLPRAIDFGGSVTLNARSARIPVRALGEIAGRFPEVMRIEKTGSAQGQMDTAATAIGVGSWWNANYVGGSKQLIGILDTGIDTGHPALSNAVSASGINLSAGSAAGNMSTSESTSSSDDFQGHGTRAAGIACSTDSTYPGVAYGALILNSKCGYLTNASSPPTQTMQFSDGRAGGDWALQNGATSITLSFAGGGSYSGTGEWALFFDAAVSSLAVPVAHSARNDGPNSSTVGTPADAFNVIACGSFDDNATASHSDDALSSSSGRGPTADGRQKPDLSGPGVNITTTEFDWETNSSFGTSLSGTSNIPPMVAGVTSLLQEYGAAAYPEGLKALLLTTADNRSPYGGPDSNWGYGALDCAAAYTYRNSVYEGQLTSTGPRYVLVRGGALAAGGRATLVWNRQVTSNGSSTPTTYYGLQDLDLYAYDASTGGQVGSSKSTVDSSEQIAVTSAVSSPIYKVYRTASSFTSSYSTEPFAVAAESTGSTQFVNPPALTSTFSTLAAVVGASADTTVQVQVSNTGDVAATAPSVTLTLPSGYSITSGANPQTLSAVAGKSSGTATWVVHSSAPATSTTVTISVDASSSSYGESIAAATVSGSQTVDVVPPTGTVSIASGAATTTTRDVTVALSATDAASGVAKMRVRNAGDAWGAWVTYATSVQTTLPAGDGTKTFEAEFMDGVGNATQTLSDTIVLDTTPPSGTVSIADGAGYVNAAAVTLHLAATDNASGVAQARFSNDGSVWSDWTAYAATAAWSMTSGDGTKTVYAQFRDAAGFVSSTTSDTITVETGRPSGSVLIADDAEWVIDRTVALTLSAADAQSGVADMRFGEDGATFGSWQPYGTSASFTLSAGDGTRTVYAQFRDGAGNTSAVVSDTVGLDTAPPTGSVAFAGGAKATPTTAVTLSLSASDTANGVARMRFSNDGSSWSAWTSYSTSAAWTLTTGDATKTVHAQFMDGVGNESATSSVSIFLDTVAPTGSMVVARGVAAVNTRDVSLGLTWADGGSGVVEVRMSNDGAEWSAWTSVSASVLWTLEAGDGARTVHLQFRDRAGNVSATASDAVLLDMTPPTGTFQLFHGAAFVLPQATLSADTSASDGASGSGVVEFRSSADGGATWSDWVPIGTDGSALVPRPADGSDRVVTILGQVRDAAGNVADVASDTTYLVDGASPSVTLVSSFAGTVGLSSDSDAVRMGLVAGDRLSLKLKVRTLVRRADAKVEIDIFGPDGTQLVTGRHPAGAKTPGVANFKAPVTGEYWIVMRPAGKAAETGASYTMSVKNVPAKRSRAKQGTAPLDTAAAPPSASVSFDAADGLKLSGSFSGPSTLPPPTLLAPDGSTVTLAVLPGPKGSRKLVALPLAGGTGTYVLTIPATADVKYKLALAPGKLRKLTE